VFAFAGIWQRWKGPIKKDGPNVDIDVYSFMTTEPNAATSSINHERSPLLLTTDEARDTWLDGAPAEAAAMVRPTSGDALRIVQEGFEKKDLLADGPQGALAMAIAPAHRRGVAAPAQSSKNASPN
jgi:putative SOS response-associated peptidase YedK